MTVSNWYDDYQTVHDLAVHLYEHGQLANTQEVFYFFEKPWKWDTEYQTWKGADSDRN